MFDNTGTTRHPTVTDLIGWLETLDPDTEITFETNGFSGPFPTPMRIDFCRSSDSNSGALVLLEPKP